MYGCMLVDLVQLHLHYELTIVAFEGGAYLIYNEMWLVVTLLDTKGQRSAISVLYWAANGKSDTDGQLKSGKTNIGQYTR